MTPRGYRQLVSELRELHVVERPRIVDEVRQAAKQGDRSENAEYQYGKRRLREIDRRVRFLTKRIERARIVDPRTQVPDRVRFGALVTTVDSDGRSRTVRIVGEDEIDLRQAKISWRSPLARALLGARQGDVVEVKAPKGDLELEILDFSYPSDDPVESEKASLVGMVHGSARSAHGAAGSGDAGHDASGPGDDPEDG